MCWRIENLLTYRSTCITNRKNKKKPKFVYASIKKIRAILYNWKMADRIEAGFSLGNRPK